MKEENMLDFLAFLNGESLKIAKKSCVGVIGVDFLVKLELLTPLPENSSN